MILYLVLHHGITSYLMPTPSKATPSAASTIYSVVVAMATTTATATQTAPQSAPIAVVAQRRAPAKGDMGARPIYGKYVYLMKHECFCIHYVQHEVPSRSTHGAQGKNNISSLLHGLLHVYV